MWFPAKPTPTLPTRLAFFQLFSLILGAVGVFAIFDDQIRDHLQERLDQELETQVLVFAAKMDGIELQDKHEGLQEELELFAQASGSSRCFFRILLHDGKQLASSNLLNWEGIEQHQIPILAISEHPFVWETAQLAREQVRLIYYQSPSAHILQIGGGMREVSELAAHLRFVFGASMVVLVLVVSAFGWLLTRRALRGIGLVRDAAARIRGQSDLAFKMPLPTGALETDELAITFNGMLEKMNELLRNMRNLMDNVAHDIRTPVARMRGLAEVELRRFSSMTRVSEAPTEEQMMDLSGMVVDECDQILQLINTLLEIAALESGIQNGKAEPLKMDEMLKEGCELFEAVIESKNQRLEWEQEPGAEGLVFADPKSMQRLVSNLLDNAIKYTPDGGVIRVRAHSADSWYGFEIEDSGIGIADSEKTRIFQRFYRADRSRSLPGNGLGLSFCAAAVKAWGGWIEVDDAASGGSCFRVFLPLFTQADGH